MIRFPRKTSMHIPALHKSIRAPGERNAFVRRCRYAMWTRRYQLRNL